MPNIEIDAHYREYHLQREIKEILLIYMRERESSKLFVNTKKIALKKTRILFFLD